MVWEQRRDKIPGQETLASQFPSEHHMWSIKLSSTKMFLQAVWLWLRVEVCVCVGGVVLCCPSKSKITVYFLSSRFWWGQMAVVSGWGNLREQGLLVLLRNGDQVRSLIYLLPRARVPLLMPSWPLWRLKSRVPVSKGLLGSRGNTETLLTLLLRFFYIPQTLLSQRLKSVASLCLLLTTFLAEGQRWSLKILCISK